MHFVQNMQTIFKTDTCELLVTTTAREKEIFIFHFPINPAYIFVFDYLMTLFQLSNLKKASRKVRR